MKHSRNCKVCGETDYDSFYKHIKGGYCKTCWNARTAAKRKAMKLRIISHMGGQCVLCGYEGYPSSYDLHHLDPSIKDKDFGHVTCWSWKRVEKELETCVLLCANCHRAVEAGYITLP